MNFSSSRPGMVPVVVPASGGAMADDACRYLAASSPSSATGVEKPLPGFSVDRGWAGSGSITRPGTSPCDTPICQNADTATFRAGTKAV